MNGNVLNCCSFADEDTRSKRINNPDSCFVFDQSILDFPK